MHCLCTTCKSEVTVRNTLAKNANIRASSKLMPKFGTQMVKFCLMKHCIAVVVGRGSHTHLFSKEENISRRLNIVKMIHGERQAVATT